MDNLLNKIHLGDCMDFMKNMHDDSIDLAIVDPPYFDGPNKGRAYYQGKNNLANCIEYKEIKTWDIPDKLYFDELKRISKNQIIWGCNYYNYILKGGRIVWIKMEKEGPFSTCEIASNSIFNKTVHFKYLWSGFWQENMKQKEKRIHPSQKPTALYRWLLQNYAKPNQLILDTHSGSGSCAIACHLENFDFIAIEKDPDYHKDSVKRFEEVRDQGVLF